MPLIQAPRDFVMEISINVLKISNCLVLNSFSSGVFKEFQNRYLRPKEHLKPGF